MKLDNKLFLITIVIIAVVMSACAMTISIAALVMNSRAQQVEAQPTPEDTAQVEAQPTLEDTAQVEAQPTLEDTAQVESQPTPEDTAQVESQPTPKDTAQVEANVFSDPLDENLPAVIDVVNFSYHIEGEEIVAEMFLRDLPETMVFNQNQVPKGENNLEYKWGLYIDIDGNKDTGAPRSCSYLDTAIGTEYEMDAAYYAQRDEETVEDKLSNRVKCHVAEYTGPSGDCWGGLFFQRAKIIIKPDENKLIFRHEFPGATQNTKVYYQTAGRNEEYDLVFDVMD